MQRQSLTWATEVKGMRFKMTKKKPNNIFQ